MRELNYVERWERDFARRGLYMHALLYTLVNITIFLIDWATPGGWWFFWPLLGWGMGLTAHIVNVLSAERWSRPVNQSDSWGEP